MLYIIKLLGCYCCRCSVITVVVAVAVAVIVVIMIDAIHAAATIVVGHQK